MSRLQIYVQKLSLFYIRCHRLSCFEGAVDAPCSSLCAQQLPYEIWIFDIARLLDITLRFCGTYNSYMDDLIKRIHDDGSGLTTVE